MTYPEGLAQDLEHTAARLGQTILAHRKQSGLTQLELSQLADVGLTPLKHAEQGKVSVQLDTLLKIFRVLGISIHLESRWIAQGNEAKQ
jgi:HTH-type transcriptional regulator / antitoxin HipB